MVQPVIVSMTPTASREMWMVLESLSSLYQWAWLLALVTTAAAAVALQRSFKGPRSFTIGFTWGQHARVQVNLESSFTPLSESIATSSSMCESELTDNSEPQALKVDNETSISAIQGRFLNKPLAASWETKMVLVIGNKGFSSFSSRTKLYSCGDLFGVSGRNSDCSCKHDFFEEYEVYDEYAENSSCCKGTGGNGRLPDEVYDDKDMKSGWSFSMPEWANSLLQPLILTSTDDLQLVSLDSDWNFASESSSLKEWDAVLEMHREMDWKEIARSILRDPRRVLRPTIVSKGPLYFAKAKDEVVRLWSSSKRRLLRTLYLPEEEGPVSALDLNWGEAASVGTRNGFLSLWDVASAKRLRSFKGSSSAAPLKAVRMNADAGVWAAGASAADGCCSSSSSCVSLWDSRAMGRNAAGSRTVSNLFGLESLGNELYVREGLESVRGYDLRMLGSSRPPLHEGSVRNYGLALNTEQTETTMRAEKKLQEETWWDAEDAELLEEEEEDDDDSDDSSCSGDGGDSSSSGKSMLSRCFGTVCRSAGLLL